MSVSRVEVSSFSSQIQIINFVTWPEQSKTGKGVGARIKEFDGQIDNLIKLESAGNISAAIFSDRIGKLEQEQAELKMLLTKNDDETLIYPTCLPMLQKQ